MNQANLELHIEELILHDFPHEQQQVIATAIEQELTRLFGEQGVPPSLMQGGDIPQLGGGTFEATPGAAPDTIGVQVAQSIYSGLSSASET